MIKGKRSDAVPGRRQSRRRAAVLLAPIVLLAGCATTPPGTGAACDALRPALPTWSSKDTEQSKREGATFLDVFNATCAKG